MKISIIGCGWLGFHLAIELLNNGFLVNGSTTSPHKLIQLEQSGINPFLIDLNSSTNLKTFLENVDIIIINIPPKATITNQLGYADKMRIILSAIHGSGLKKVIFISSTSVYADENQVVTELTTTSKSEAAMRLTEAENVFLSDVTLQTTLLRLSGLIGGGRHPIKSLSGKTGVQNPDSPVNLIHRDDCIQIILRLINENKWGDTFNVASPHHPSRVEYYSRKAAEFKLSAPKFDYSKASIGKTISSQKIVDRLNFTFTDI